MPPCRRTVCNVGSAVVMVVTVAVVIGGTAVAVSGDVVIRLGVILLEEEIELTLPLSLLSVSHLGRLQSCI